MPQHQHLSIMHFLRILAIRILQHMPDADPGALSDNPNSQPQGRKSFKRISGPFLLPK